ncbi:hypothetical protein [[Mycoplasma] anseris]|uniref:DUF3899 domain-containing protein n=1 Tax=[Mycoplasma] anseris TaxID=92400 RepID=A0A2Z4ND16_9BACT|nr:hypothetical protein [[Mycoplasma] anseris]AWX69439.1 hypothetical protein DP065_01560 [[Mycoplasma] anseris]
MKEKLTFKEYWNNSWNLFSIIYLCVSIVGYLAILFGVKYGVNKNWVDTLSVVAIIMVSVNLLALLFRWGLGKGIIKVAKSGSMGHKLTKMVNKEFKKPDNRKTKEQLYIDMRRKLDDEEKQKEKTKLLKPKMTNLVFYLFLILSGIILICILPSLLSKK